MNKKKILITGSNGFLGSNLARFFSDHPGYDVILTSQRSPVEQFNAQFIQGDLRNEIFVKTLFDTINPEIVINTVSLVNVDLCEEQPDLAQKITVDTAVNIARYSQKTQCHNIYISTDHLFKGDHSEYLETEIPAPVNKYGHMKMIAEQKTQELAPESAVIRTNFFGWSPKGHAQTFGEWMYTNLADHRPMTLFTDYYFSPIEVHYLAEALEPVIQTKFSGIVNVSGSERCSKYDFGLRLAHAAGFPTDNITPSTMTDTVFKAKRQPDLSLSTRKYRTLFHKDLPGLDKSLKRFLDTRPL